MNSELPEYNGETVFEDIIANTLLNLPWESDTALELRDKVFEIINSYEGNQGAMRIICLYWLLSDQHEYEEKTNLLNNQTITERMEIVARILMNAALKEMDIQISLIQKH
ncbi:hypothetical protein [Xenorhabdus entomophaga]|uniref:hypothetical protein n=1 Tax=Xenorhabdus entomophaga TaxID=3136257 RepID=UPI0030F4A282